MAGNTIFNTPPNSVFGGYQVSMFGYGVQVGLFTELTSGRTFLFGSALSPVPDRLLLDSNIGPSSVIENQIPIHSEMPQMNGIAGFLQKGLSLLQFKDAFATGVSLQNFEEFSRPSVSLGVHYGVIGFQVDPELQSFQSFYGPGTYVGKTPIPGAGAQLQLTAGLELKGTNNTFLDDNTMLYLDEIVRQNYIQKILNQDPSALDRFESQSSYFDPRAETQQEIRDFNARRDAAAARDAGIRDAEAARVIEAAREAVERRDYEMDRADAIRTNDGFMGGSEDSRTSQQRFNDTVRGIGPNAADNAAIPAHLNSDFGDPNLWDLRLSSDTGTALTGGLSSSNSSAQLNTGNAPANSGLTTSHASNAIVPTGNDVEVVDSNYGNLADHVTRYGLDSNVQDSFGQGSFGQSSLGNSDINDDSSDYNSGFDDYSYDAYYMDEPILLDLDGTDGVEITPLTSSNVYMDMAGDGYKHRTAWAGSGDGVLVYDVGNDGIINQRNEIVFTDWDPSAGSDFEALKSVFDSNNDGLLSAADTNFANFKIMKTNADGTTTLVSLASESIVSINLIADKTLVTLEDGSQITGQTTFTRTGGSTGTAADVGLLFDAQGYAVTQTIVGGTVTNTARNADGSIASVTSLNTLVSGTAATRTLTHDDDGDGVNDRVQSDAYNSATRTVLVNIFVIRQGNDNGNWRHRHD